MKKTDISDLIYYIEIKMEKLQEESLEARDMMSEADGAYGELQLMLWKLEKMK
jgi:hypothetical protein